MPPATARHLRRHRPKFIRNAAVKLQQHDAIYGSANRHRDQCDPDAGERHCQTVDGDEQPHHHRCDRDIADGGVVHPHIDCPFQHTACTYGVQSHREYIKRAMLNMYWRFENAVCN